MAVFASLYSGSSGNCSLVEDGGTVILVDMGGSAKRAVEGLYSLGYSASDVDAVLVTHEHSDHVSGLATFLKHYRVPVYGSERTIEYLSGRSVVPNNARLFSVSPGQAVEIGGISVASFRTCHDSADCVGYRFAFPSGARAAVATDLGYITDEVFASICGCGLVALESNYDEEMLVGGKYPYYLKSRILSPTGHLSNADCAEVAARLAENGTKRLVLMHLSNENNVPDVALTNCLSALENCGAACSVSVAARFGTSGPFEIEASECSV